MLNKEDILGIKLKTKTVELDQGEVCIKEFTTSDREKFEMLAIKMSKSGAAKNMKAKLLAISIVKEDGGRMFGDDEIGKISQMPSKVTELLFNEILELNGMGADALGDTEGK